jgi:hypothetical protein
MTPDAPVPEQIDDDAPPVDDVAGTPVKDVLTLRRFAELDAAIEAHPAAPVNYLLRGELLLARGWPTEAIPDFDQVIALVRDGAAEDDWSSVNNALLARAESGLAKAVKAVRNHNLRGL